MIPYADGVHLLRPSQVREADVVYRAAGWSVFWIPDGLASRSDLFRVTGDALPTDPLYEAGESWDWWFDCLLGGLDAVQSPVLVLWPDGSTLASRDPASFAHGLTCFQAASVWLAGIGLEREGPPLVVLVGLDEHG